MSATQIDDNFSLVIISTYILNPFLDKVKSKNKSHMNINLPTIFFPLNFLLEYIYYD